MAGRVCANGVTLCLCVGRVSLCVVRAICWDYFRMGGILFVCPLRISGYQVLYVGFLCLLPVCAFLSDGMDVCAHVPARVLS